MFKIKAIAFGVALVAVVLPLWVDVTTQAQKTGRNSFQQAISSRPSSQSVYGDYQQSSRQQPIQQQQQQVSSFQRQRTQQQSYGRQSVQQPVYQQQESAESSSSSEQAEAAAEPASYGAVAGQPGRDFPAYTQVPKTSFSCDGLPYDYGMYADEETGCQAFHVCYNGRKDSFLCGPGTVFNQRILHCDYWYSVDCGKSSQYYGSNAYMGSSQPEPGPAQANEAPVAQRQPSGSFPRPQIANRPANNYNQQRDQSASSSFSRNTQQQQQVQEEY